MIKILTHLSNNKLFNIVIVFLFFLLVSLPHEFVGVNIAALFKGVPRSQYDLTILVIGMMILGGFTFALVRQARLLKEPKYPIFYFLFCLLMMIVSLNILIIVNIEIIHFIQYAVMAILLFPLCKNFLSTLALVTLLGAIDEAYQYYFLSPERTNYYDFNDVILNLLGGAMGLIFLRFHRDIATLIYPDRQSIHKKTWIKYFVFICTGFLLIWQKVPFQKLLDTLGLPFDWAEYGARLIRKPTTGFWTEIPPKIIYHVVQPIEGVLIVSLLLLTFSFLYKGAE